MKELSKNVSLHCPVCDNTINTIFSVVDESLKNTNLM